MEKVSCYYCLGGRAEELKGDVNCNVYKRLITREDAFLVPHICPAYFYNIYAMDTLKKLKEDGVIKAFDLVFRGSKQDDCSHCATPLEYKKGKAVCSKYGLLHTDKDYR
jgi:hypothetical protein